jgi:hypothetical protein
MSLSSITTTICMWERSSAIRKMVPQARRHRRRRHVALDHDAVDGRVITV